MVSKPIGPAEMVTVLNEEIGALVDAVDAFQDREDSDPIIRVWIRRLVSLSLAYETSGNNA